MRGPTVLLVRGHIIFVQSGINQYLTLVVSSGFSGRNLISYCQFSVTVASLLKDEVVYVNLVCTEMLYSKKMWSMTTEVFTRLCQIDTSLAEGSQPPIL